MFAVPGWSVNASLLKTSTAEKHRTAADGANSAGEAPASKPLSNKKRKRMEKMGVNKDNLADLWETVIEGKENKEPGEKRQKIEKEHGTITETPKTEGKKGKKEKKDKKVNAKTATHTEGIQEWQAVKPMEDTKEGSFVKKGKTMKEKKREKKAKLLAEKNGTTPADEIAQSAPDPSPNVAAAAPTKPVARLTPLQASMRQKLISARFRHLNQELYTKPSATSLTLFSDNPEMFVEYHEGFRRQVEVWPENPVDGYISTIRERGAIKGPTRGAPLDRKAEIQPLPRTQNTCNIADLGCGDAALSMALQKDSKKLNLKIRSFDLQSPSSLVTKADIANLPLPNDSIDVAIFCLALMGTNWLDFIEEAFRILRWKGELWIAEIKSRFGRVGGSKDKKVVSHSVGNRKKPQAAPKETKGDKKQQEFENQEIAAVEVDGQDKAEATDVSSFVEVLRKRGFVLKGEGQGGELTAIDLNNKMFVRMHFVKGSTPIKGKGVPVPKDMEKMTGEKTWSAKRPGKKFLDEEAEEDHVSSEAAVLKPCVYKLR